MQSVATHFPSGEVAILGGGVAASATAIALASAGIRSLLLLKRIPQVRMVEALPAAALPLLEALDLTATVARFAVATSGLDNRWQPEAPTLRNDRFLVVDRVDLADALLAEAQRRGVRVLETGHPPRLIKNEDGVSILLGSETLSFDFAIDASGRTAAWSQPIKRIRHLYAEIFVGRCDSESPALTLARDGESWAYRLKIGDHATVGLLSGDLSRCSEMPSRIARTLGVDVSAFRWVGRRVAFVQWCNQPISGNRLAVGDAALAHDPLSGQGIRFALSSALAVRAVIRTMLHRAHDCVWAERFYDEFVATERRRHGALLQSLYGSQFDLSAASGAPFAQANDGLPPLRGNESLRFDAVTERAPIQVSGYIEPGEVIRLGDGGAVRWLGGFDLLRLCDLIRSEVSLSQLIALMGELGIPPNRAQNVIIWCHQKGILKTTRD